MKKINLLILLMLSVLGYSQTTPTLKQVASSGNIAWKPLIYNSNYHNGAIPLQVMDKKYIDSIASTAVQYATMPISIVTNTVSLKYSTGLAVTSNSLVLANTAVTPATYSLATVTVDQQGRITSASSGTASSPLTFNTPLSVTTNTVSLTYGTGLSVSSGSLITSAIPNSAITNSLVTINSSSVALGGSVTVTANTTNSLTVDNSSLQYNSGTTFDGSAAKTISVKNLGITNAMIAAVTIDLTTKVTGILPTANGGTGQNSTATFPASGVVVTEAGTETLSNKTVTPLATNTLAITATTTVNGNSNFSTTISASSSTLTAVTFAYLNISDGGIIYVDYLKGTASDLVLTFPSGSLVSSGSNCTVSGGALVATLISTSSGRYTIQIIRFGSLYKIFITNDTP